MYDKLKRTLAEVSQPLSKGEKNFKALHKIDYKNVVPGVTDQDHIFNGNKRREDPKSASYENFRDDDESVEAYDQDLKVNETPDTDVDVSEATLSAKAARAGKDIGKPGKEFHKIAAKAGKKYGSKAAGERVAGAILAKMRAKKMRREEAELEEALGTIDNMKKATKFGASNISKMDREEKQRKAARPTNSGSLQHRSAKTSPVKTGMTREEAELDEAAGRTDTYIGTIHKDDPDYDKKLSAMKSKAVGGHRVRGRAPLDKYKHLYQKSGELHRHSSQDIKPEHSARVDVYSRKPMKEASMSHSLGDHDSLRKYAHEHGGIDREDMLQAAHHIEHGQHEGLKSKLRKMDTDPRDFVLGHVHKKHWSGLGYTPMREEAEQVDEVLTKKTPAGEWIHDFQKSKNPKFAGKSPEKRKQMALAAYYAKKRNEGYAPDPKPKLTPDDAKKLSKVHDMMQRERDLAAKKKLKKESYIPESDDWEGRMSKTELSAIRDKASKLISMINDSDDLEAWVQSKISYAKVQLDGVYDYMTYSGEHKSPSDSSSDYDQSGQMASNYGNFMNRMGEEVELDEAKRGRPRKNASSSDSEVEGGADMHPMMQARKAISLRGQHTFTHKSGESYKMEPSMAHKILAHHDNLKTTAQKQEFSDRVAHSKAEMNNALAGKPAAKKPRVSLGSMKMKESLQSDKGPFKMMLSTGADGKPKFIKRSKDRKEIAVEELIGGQKKLDKNHNGKLDKMDFKLLRKKKKMMEAEEMTAANVAKAAATQTKFGVVGDRNMQQDSVDKISKDVQASDIKVKLPPTQGNKPIGGDTQTHPEMAESVLNKLYDTLSLENRAKFDVMMGSQDGIDTLLAFAEEHGI